jgi:hypothetical protein
MLQPLIKGIISYVPGSEYIIRKRGTRGRNLAEYSYGVWLKHITLLNQFTRKIIPRSLGELGPGDSIAVGLAALISGVEKYTAMDVVKYVDIRSNLKIFNQLIDLFRSRAARPTKGWPDFDRYLNESLFPDHIFTEDLLNRTLSESWTDDIRHAIRYYGDYDENCPVNYIAPFNDTSIIAGESVDMILSHSVMEHVNDLNECYQFMHYWLKKNGVITHQIDYRSHGTSRIWNGYRAYPEYIWKIIVGKRPYLINRHPHSVHMRSMIQNGFDIKVDLRRMDENGILRKNLSSAWKSITNEDLICSGAFIQAVKK